MATADANVAFKDIDAAILVGAMPRKEGMERKDLLKANARIFEAQGKALDQVAKKTVKVSRLLCCCRPIPSQSDTRLCKVLAGLMPSWNFILFHVGLGQSLSSYTRRYIRT